MKLRHLESALEDVAAFDPEHQDVMLEQYPTSPHLAANLIHTAAETYGDIEVQHRYTACVACTVQHRGRCAVRVDRWSISAAVAPCSQSQLPSWAPGTHTRLISQMSQLNLLLQHGHWL